MRVIHLTIVLLAVMSLCGCEWIVADTKNVGSPSGTYPRLIAHVNVPIDMYDGADVEWIAEITGGIPPFEVEWNFGGGADPNVINESTTGNSAVSTKMISPDAGAQPYYSGSITISDFGGVTEWFSFNYEVMYPPNLQPIIDSATFAGSVLTVMAHDDDGDPLTITVDPPRDALVDAATQDYVDGGITFTFSTDNLISGVSGDVEVTASDGIDNSDPVAANLTINGIWPIPADSLYALRSGGLVVILTGATANPFQYLNGVGLTVDDGADYEHGTFNVGAPGGGAGDTDGAWTAMNLAGGFLLPPDNFIIKTDIGGGRGRIDFNLTPIGGSDVIGMEGMLINFGLTGTAGTYTLGFQEFSGVERTYYTDGATNIYYWGTLMADETGALAAGITVDNTYTIN